MGSKKSKAPDYRGAAEQQGADSRYNTEYQTNANRISQYTPWGSSEFSKTAGEDGMPQWSQTTNLNPMDQQILDQDRGISLGRSGIAGALMPGLYEQMMRGSQGSQNAPEWMGTPDGPQYGGLPGLGNSDIQVPGSSPTGEQILGAVGGMNPYTQGQQGSVAGFTQFQPGQRPDTQFQPGQATNIQGQVQDAGYDPRFAQANYDRQMSLMAPGREQAAVGMEAQLRNQGLRPGTEAYDNQMQTFRDQQGEELNRLSNDSILRGAAEQQNQFGRNLAGGQFANQAAGQQFGQGMSLGQQAASQRGQEFGENMSIANQMAQQRAQQFGEQNQQFNQSMGLADQMSQQRGQQFGELQALQQMLGGQDQAAFDRQMQLGQWKDNQRRQMMQEQLGFGGQQFDQSMQQQQAQNQLRQAYRSEQMQDQGWNLNMINSLLSGGQIGMPNMPNFNPAGRADTTNYLGAANSQGNWDMAANQNAMAPWQALGQIGGGLAMGGF